MLLSLLIAALGATVAILVNRGDTSTAMSSIRTTAPAAPTGETTVTPPKATTTVPTPTVPTVTQPTVGPPSAPTAWPAGASGWTVVLASVPTSAGRTAAESQARRAANAGLSDVGVLDSSQFSSLHPGYYVVFSGIYQSLGAAQSAASVARSHGYSSAYPRRVSS